MLHRGPVVITTLEEDFKKIGLIAESKSLTEDTETEAEGAEPTDESPETIDERRIMRRTVAGGRKLARTQRTPIAKKQKAKRYHKRMKNRIKLKRQRKMRKPLVRRRAKILRGRAAKRRGESANNPIANLIEEVADIVASIETAPKTDAIKSFANIAIISDLLANTFNEWSEGLTEETSDQETFDTLVEAAESLADLAEAAAEIATALKNGDELEGDEGVLEAIFKEYMEDLLEGMDIYNEATAQMEADTMHGKAGNIGQPNALKKKGEKVAESDEDLAEEDDEEDDEDEEDDDDEDDEKEGKKMPAFLKKKIAAKESADEGEEGEEERPSKR
jgi:hypothetical protein